MVAVGLAQHLVCVGAWPLELRLAGLEPQIHHLYQLCDLGK